jgi:hypothetical protein
VDSNNITVKDIQKIKTVIKDVLNEIGEFTLLDAKVLPEGLTPIARSMSWLIEQIVVQNLRKASKHGISKVLDPPHRLTQYDCTITLNDDPKSYKINVKTSLTSTNESGKFDISKAEKLIRLYEDEKDLILLVAVIKVEVSGLQVKFKDVIVFNVAWTPDIYYNRANHNLQSKCDGNQTIRTNQDFVSELKKLMGEAGHGTHY